MPTGAALEPAKIFYPQYFDALLMKLGISAPFNSRLIRVKDCNNDIGWSCFGVQGLQLYTSVTFGKDNGLGGPKGSLTVGIIAKSTAAKLKYRLLISDKADINRKVTTAVAALSSVDPDWGLPKDAFVEEQIQFTEYCFNIRDRSDWPAQFDWIMVRLLALYRSVSPRI